MKRSESTGKISESISDDSTQSLTSFSGPLGIPHRDHLISRSSSRTSRKSISFSDTTTTHHHSQDDSDEPYVEITLDIRDDSVAVHSVHPAGAGALSEDPELALLAKRTLEGNRSSLLASASTRMIRQVSQEIKRLASYSKRASASARRFDRTKSAANHALKGLKFITGKTGVTGGANAWPAVEKRFDGLTANNSDGLLHCSLFGECIGMFRTTIFLLSVCL